MRSIIFGRVGWLEHYDSSLDDDGPRFGGSYNDENIGSEIDNFRFIRGYAYGYIQPPSKSGGFNIDRVESMEDVLVVMCAKSPKLRKQVVVGWYANAKLLDESKERRDGYGLYNFLARAEDVVPLPLEHRTWEVPTGRGALGQSNVFYLLTPDGKRRRDPWIRQVIRQIDHYNGTEVRMAEIAHAAGQGIGLSAADRAKVEERAMVEAEKHYQDLGYETERHGRPFDLLCRRGRKELRVEVKGTTGEGHSVLVTIGEVESARAHATDLFVLSEIELTPRGAQGGQKKVISPWKPTSAQLQPKVLQYTCKKASR